MTSDLRLFAPREAPAPPLPPWGSVWGRVDCPRRGLCGMIVRRTSYRPDLREWWLEVEATDGTRQHVRLADCRPHEPQATNEGETP